jgi:hypothetical protein
MFLNITTDHGWPVLCQTNDLTLYIKIWNVLNFVLDIMWTEFEMKTHFIYDIPVVILIIISVISGYPVSIQTCSNLILTQPTVTCHIPGQQVTLSQLMRVTHA